MPERYEAGMVRFHVCGKYCDLSDPDHQIHADSSPKFDVASAGLDAYDLALRLPCRMLPCLANAGHPCLVGTYPMVKRKKPHAVRIRDAMKILSEKNS